jgi:phage gp36-like protein
MSYATIEDLELLIPTEQLVMLTDDYDTGEVVTTIVETALSNASIVIDSYLSARYSLPLASPPQILKVMCTHIAGYQLQVRRESVSETWEKQHANALKFLTKISEGSLSLGATDPVVSGGESEALQVSVADSIFSREEMDKY